MAGRQVGMCVCVCLCVVSVCLSFPCKWPASRYMVGWWESGEVGAMNPPGEIAGGRLRTPRRP